jgi:hypothetical protein
MFAEARDLTREPRGFINATAAAVAKLVEQLGVASEISWWQKYTACRNDFPVACDDLAYVRYQT